MAEGCAEDAGMAVGIGVDMIKAVLTCLPIRTTPDGARAGCERQSACGLWLYSTIRNVNERRDACVWR